LHRVNGEGQVSESADVSTQTVIAVNDVMVLFLSSPVLDDSLVSDWLRQSQQVVELATNEHARFAGRK